MKRISKRLFRTFIRDENGAVSIYAVMVIILLFFFNAVLIDFVRVMVAEHQAEAAAQKAMRSAFSAYEKDLQLKGLYAYYDADVGSAQEIFDEVYEKNISADGSYFQFVDNKLETSSLTSDENRTLANKEVFKHQILEEMKYRGPIQYGKMVSEKFMPVACTMEKSSEFTSIASEVEEEFDKRATYLQSVESNLTRRSGGATSEINSIKRDVKPNAKGGVDYPDVRNVGDIIQHYEDYQNDLDDEETDKTDDFENNAYAKVNKMNNATSATKKKLEKANNQLTKAIKENEKIEKQIKKVKQENAEKYNRVKQKCKNENHQGLEEANESVSNYLIPPEDLREVQDLIEESLDALETSSKSLSSEINDLKQRLDKIFKQNQDLSLNKNSYAHPISKAFNDSEKKIAQTYDTFNKSVPKKYYEHKLNDKSKLSEAKDNASKKFTEIQDFFNTLNGIRTDENDYTKLQELLQKYNGANAVKVDDLGDGPEDSTDQAMSMMGSLMDSMGDLLAGVRDEAYINEYIMTRFNSAKDPGEVGGCSGPLYQCANAYLYEQREIEYIIYGSHTPGMNYGYALTELFFTRLALNMASVLVNSEQVKLAPHPWLKFWIALTEALGLTLQDMKALTQGNDVNLVDIGKFRENAREKGVTIDTDYHFYLRLYLFLHPEGDTLHRVQASVDKVVSTEMDQLPTYMKGNVKSSIDLWFLPGITSMLGRADIISGDVEDGRYIINNEVNYSY
ncbi:DUF5702 domain-containing protein [Pontibacillus salicampi]|uniref:DUF5702 domain-containing protein n=1 Tax=Pontibacillus salicampi TaxID=1449801 RepID=A0ABV6LUC3_9BACI